MAIRPNFPTRLLRDSDRRPDPYGRPDPYADSERLRGRRERDSVPEDYGQADYSERYAYDPRTRTGYRADPSDIRGRDDAGERYAGSNPFRREDEPRTFGTRELGRESYEAEREREMRASV